MAPRRIISLDIETTVSDPKGLIDENQLILAGLKNYRVNRSCLTGFAFRHFESEHMRSLQRVIASNAGPIVGYNILGFDYVVLFHHGVDISGMLRRTVDLMEFLRHKVGQLRGLKLNKVCEALLGKTKLLDDSRGVERMWAEGRKADVLAYNERDCDLAADLWHYLYFAKRVTLLNKTFRITNRDRQFLAGRQPMQTYREWLRTQFIAQVQETRVDRFQGVHENPIDLAHEFDRMVCRATGQVLYTRLIPEHDVPSGSDRKPRNCPACGEYVFDSPEEFKASPSNDGSPVPLARLERLWSLIDRHVVDIEDHHFDARGLPRDPFTREDILFNKIGVDRSVFESWFQSVKKNPMLRRFVPSFEKRMTYTTRSGMRALERSAKECGVDW